MLRRVFPKYLVIMKLVTLSLQPTCIIFAAAIRTKFLNTSLFIWQMSFSPNATALFTYELKPNPSRSNKLVRHSKFQVYNAKLRIDLKLHRIKCTSGVHRWDCSKAAGQVRLKCFSESEWWMWTHRSIEIQLSLRRTCSRLFVWSSSGKRFNLQWKPKLSYEIHHR